MVESYAHADIGFCDASCGNVLAEASRGQRSGVDVGCSMVVFLQTVCEEWERFGES